MRYGPITLLLCWLTLIAAAPAVAQKGGFKTKAKRAILIEFASGSTFVSKKRGRSDSASQHEQAGHTSRRVSGSEGR